MVFDRHFQGVRINENISHLTKQHKCVEVNLEGSWLVVPGTLIPQITYFLQYNCPTDTAITRCYGTS
jgi:hypothetical protein